MKRDPILLGADETAYIKHVAMFAHMDSFMKQFNGQIPGDVFNHVERIRSSRKELKKQFLHMLYNQRTGNFSVEGDWQDYAGQGFHAFRRENQTVTARINTPEENAQTETLLLLGMDYSGAKYAKPYVEQLAASGLVADPQRITVHGMASTVPERSAHIHALASGDTDIIGPDAEAIVRNYIVPKLLDGNGRYRSDLLEHYRFNIVAHSHGTALAFCVENALRDALLHHPHTYGLPETLPVDTARALMKRTRIVGFGGVLPPPGSKADNPALPTATNIMINATSDLLVGKDKALIGAFQFANMLGEPPVDLPAASTVRQRQAFLTGEGQPRLLYLLKDEEIKASERFWGNAGGHGFKFLLDGLTEHAPDTFALIKELLANPERDLVRDATATLHAQPYDRAFLGALADHELKHSATMGFATAKQLSEEADFWQRLHPGKEHRFFGDLSDRSLYR